MKPTTRIGLQFPPRAIQRKEKVLIPNVHTYKNKATSTLLGWGGVLLITALLLLIQNTYLEEIDKRDKLIDELIEALELTAPKPTKKETPANTGTQKKQRGQRYA